MSLFCISYVKICVIDYFVYQYLYARRLFQLYLEMLEPGAFSKRCALPMDLSSIPLFSAIHVPQVQCRGRVSRGQRAGEGAQIQQLNWIQTSPPG